MFSNLGKDVVLTVSKHVVKRKPSLYECRKSRFIFVCTVRNVNLWEQDGYVTLRSNR